MAYTTINNAAAHRSTLLYTGNGAARSLTGVGFAPDFIWIKDRDESNGHNLWDIVRGATKYQTTNQNLEELTNPSSGWVSAFDADGFSGVTGASSYNNWNKSGNDYVAWNWKAGGAASSNSSGSLTSSVSVNTTAGFSICKYTGATGAQTFGHGLGAVPEFIMIKNLDSSGGSAEHWRVYHHKRGAGKWLKLNDTSAEASDTGPFSDTTPTSTLVYVGGDDGTCKNGESHIAYCFAPKVGYSKFGTYDGNGGTDGSYIHTGFRPEWVLVKNVASGAHWMLYDNAIIPYNLGEELNRPNEAGASITSASGEMYDFYSNGFKARASSNNNTNHSGNTYVYAAFGQTIVGTNNVPATAR